MTGITGVERSEKFNLCENQKKKVRERKKEKMRWSSALKISSKVQLFVQSVEE